MIIRVDDFPCGNERGEREFDAMDAIQSFADALDAPFCLGVVVGNAGSGFTTHEEWLALRQLPDAFLACHGFEHRVLTHEGLGELRELRQFFGEHAVMIPPKNRLDLGAVERLAVAGFDAACTGPETRRDCPGIEFTDIIEVPSAFYGTAEMFTEGGYVLGPWDCCTLHLTWERRGGKGYPGDAQFGAVRRFGEEHRGEIRPWGDFLEVVARC